MVGDVVCECECGWGGLYIEGERDDAERRRV